MQRIEAAKRGLKIYETDKPCKHGHRQLRYTSSGTCVECAAANSATRHRAVANQAVGWVEFIVRVPEFYANSLHGAAEVFRTGDLQARARMAHLITQGCAPGAPGDVALPPARESEDMVPSDTGGWDLDNPPVAGIPAWALVRRDGGQSE